MFIFALLALAIPLQAAQVQIIETPDGKVAVHEGRRIGLRFESSMVNFEKADTQGVDTGKIVFTGSSSMVGWKTVARDMAPLPVTNRAFGGSDSGQLWYYADRAVLPLKPKVVVIYIGDNDMPQQGVSVAMYMKYVQMFVERVRAEVPDCRFVFLPCKASVARWHLWLKFQDANAALKTYCDGDEKIEFVDTNSVLLDADGIVRPECYGTDKLHFLPFVYGEWTKLLKPVVEKLWAEASAQASARQ